MNRTNTIAAIVALIISLLVVTFAGSNERSNKKESVYDRVVKSGVIRCGYGISAPWILKNAETGQMEGVAVELMEAVAKTLDLKVEWTEETGWGGLPTALETGRVDVGCSSLWVRGAYGKRLSYTKPYIYNALHAFVRADDTRFDNAREFADLNRAGIKVSTVDGEITDALRTTWLPLTDAVSLPQGSSVSESFLLVSTGKADLVVMDPISLKQFNEANNNALKRVPLTEPVVIYEASLPVALGEFELRDMLNAGIIEISGTGELKAVFEKYKGKIPEGAIYFPKNYE